MRKIEPDMDCQSRHDDLELRVMKLEATLANSGFANRGGAYLIRCCALKIITIIKKNLHKQNLEVLEKSCFGHLLKMNQLRFQGQLLLHINMAASNNNTLVFNINNSNMQFGPTDFQFITGLCFRTSEATNTSSRIHEDVFRGKPTITFKDVEEAFLDVSHDHGGKGSATLKLALLYLLYGVVLPVNPCKQIDLRYLHLVDNLREFRAFPWGRVGYELLVSSVLSARLRLDCSRATRLVLPGFTFALQVWAYEKMPSLAAHCAALAPNSEDLKARILRWSATKIVRSDDLKIFFTLGDDEVEPSTSADTNSSIPQEERRPQSEDTSCDELPRNEAPPPKVEDEEAVKEPTPTRNTTSGPNPISMAETERNRALFALAFDSPAVDTPQPLWKTCREFEISEDEYRRSKAVYEMLLERAKRLKLWISYAQFEAFAVIQGSESEPELPDKRKSLERARAVFERGLSYFRSCAPRLNEERATLLKEWLDMEYRFGNVGDVGSVRARMPQKKPNKKRLFQN